MRAFTLGGHKPHTTVILNWSCDRWSLTVSACIASHSWGDWILWARSLVASWGLVNKNKTLNYTLSTHKNGIQKYWVMKLKYDTLCKHVFLTKLFISIKLHDIPRPHHHLTHQVHYWADHKIPWCCPSQSPYSKGWWPCLCKGKICTIKSFKCSLYIV